MHDSKYLTAKIKSYQKKSIQIFMGVKYPIFKMGRNYSPQIFLQNTNTKERKITTFITDNITENGDDDSE